MKSVQFLLLAWSRIRLVYTVHALFILAFLCHNRSYHFRARVIMHSIAVKNGLLGFPSFDCFQFPVNDTFRRRTFGFYAKVRCCVCLEELFT